MRPAGEVRLALLNACRQLATPERAPTLQEIAAKACVGFAAARNTVPNAGCAAPEPTGGRV
jgi:hypothetical protein